MLVTLFSAFKRTNKGMDNVPPRGGVYPIYVWNSCICNGVLVLVFQLFFMFVFSLPSPAFLPRTAAPSATSRLLLHDKIHDEVMEKVLKRTATVSVGDPLRGEGGSFMGPLVSGPQRDKVLGFISRVSCALEVKYRHDDHVMYSSGYEQIFKIVFLVPRTLVFLCHSNMPRACV